MARTLGRYRLIEPIATGGMAEVWRAEAPGAEGFVKEVALKLVRADQRSRSDFVRMFIREARLASRLTHANVVQVFDFDRVGDEYYIAMELVRGRTLREVVDRCRAEGIRFGLGRAVQVCAEVARGLSYAHRLEEGGQPVGLVHRDVSPQNVLVSFEGEVKLADFGIARALGADETVAGSLKGKLSYMAPEQARGERVDARADVFALGALLWELCTGRRLFARDNDAATLSALLSDEPVSAPSSWNELVPPELDALVLAALECDPARRTGSAEELAAGLSSVAHQLTVDGAGSDLRALMGRLWPRGGAAPRAGEELAEPPAPQAVGERKEATAPTLTLPEGRKLRRRRRVAILSGVALSCALVAGATFAWHRSSALSRERAEAAAAPVEAPVAAGPQPGGSEGEQTSTSLPTAGIAQDVVAPPAPAPSDTPVRQQPLPYAAQDAVAPRATAPSGSASERGVPVVAGPIASTLDDDPRAARRGEMSARPLVAPAAHVKVLVSPWALLRVDGAPAGEAPLERALKPGRRRLRASHPTLGEDAIEVELRPGQRFVWQVHLAR